MFPEATDLIRIQTERSQNNEHSSPIYLTSSYSFEDADDMRLQFSEEKEGHIYSRYANPNIHELISKLASVEKAQAGWATATGMSAIFTLFGALLSSGDHVIACRSVFGSTHRLLNEIFPKWGIATSWVAYDDYAAFESSITPTTKLIYLESPSNPALDIIDIARVSQIADKYGVLLVVDNCFATPLLQQPLSLGAHVSIHSATKFIDGQGRTLGGIILSSSEIIAKVKAFARHTGPAMSPFNAWILSKSLETLDVRLERHCKNALEIARRLENQPSILKVKYPFLPSHREYEIAIKQMRHGGGLVTFELKGGLDSGKRFLNALRLFSLTANLGDVRSIATHPASTTHSKLSADESALIGVSEGMVRLSIGLEYIEHIWDDIAQALSVSDV